MSKTYIEEKTFEKIDFSQNGFEKGEYENCLFINCVFSNTDLSHSNFSQCEFKNCNLSITKTANTGLRDVRFIDCKLLGFHFDTCNKFLLTVYFQGCILNLSSFYGQSLKKTTFKNCSLQEVDFSEADLTGSLFDNCDFSRAIFEHTVIEKADLRTSFNYSIDPQANKIKKAKFSMNGIAGLLYKYDIEIE